MAEQILDLSTLDPDRPFITVDGQDYDMVVPGDLGMLDTHRVRRLNGPLVAYTDVDEPTDKQIATAEKALEDLITIMVPSMPKKVAARLKAGQRLQITEGFMKTKEWKAMRGKAADEEDELEDLQNRPTSGTLSPDSNGATEVTLSGG